MMSNDQLAKCRVHGIPENSTSATAFSPLVDWPPVANSCGCVHSSVNRSQACPSICFTVDQAFQTIPARSKEVFHVRLYSNYWLGTRDVLYVQCELELTKRDKVHTAVANAESDVTSLCSVVQPFNCPIQSIVNEGRTCCTKCEAVQDDVRGSGSPDNWAFLSAHSIILLLVVPSLAKPPLPSTPESSLSTRSVFVGMATTCLVVEFLSCCKNSWLCFLFTLIPTPCHLWAHFSNVVTWLDKISVEKQVGRMWIWYFWVVCPFKCVRFERPWLRWSGWCDWEGLSNRGQSKMAQSVRARVMHCHTPDTSLTPWLYWCIRTDLSYTKFSRKLDLMWKNNQNLRCY